MKKLIISGTGCSLGDFLYNGVDFSSDKVNKYFSKKAGDGGLIPGQLVFLDEFEEFANKTFNDVLQDIIGEKKEPDTFNLGGPAIVALINIAQLLEKKNISINFYGAMGEDQTGERILDILKKTPVNIDNYSKLTGGTPFTQVFSDPNFNNGHGERSFINNIGAAWNYLPEHLDDSFYRSDVVFIGASGLVPKLHDGLTEILQKAKKNNCITVVTTVYDFRNEKKNPKAKWPLGKSDETFKYIDLLIADMEEALRISGTNDIESAIEFYKNMGVGTVIVTNGPEPIYAFSNGTLFEKTSLSRISVADLVTEDLKLHPEKKGDTTGCGDNFAGGIIASLMMQLQENKNEKLDLQEACSWGVSSGGFACYYMGGTFEESYVGEKLEKVSKIYQEYLKDRQ